MDASSLLANEQDAISRTVGVSRRGSANTIAASPGGFARSPTGSLSQREWLYHFLEPNRPPNAVLRAQKEQSQLVYTRARPAQAGLWFENFIVAVILINVVSYVLSTLDLQVRISSQQ